MILIIDICKEKLHYYEFVKPICDILDNDKIKYFVKSYKDIAEKDLENCSKVIICGTSLYDNEFNEEKNLKYFSWILNFKKPVLGICGGMQIIGLIFDGKLGKKTEIGYYEENFKENFLGLFGEVGVYHLHNNFIQIPAEFEVFSHCSHEKIYICQAMKHKNKEIYAVLFHPEVRQKHLIVNFCTKIV